MQRNSLLRFRLILLHGGIAIALSMLLNSSSFAQPLHARIRSAKKMSCASFTISGVKNDTLDFGYVSCQTTKDSSFVLTNTFPNSIFLSVHSTDTTLFQSLWKSGSIAIQAQQLVSLEFTAGEHAPGTYFDSLLVVDTCGDTTTIVLRATIDSVKISISEIHDTTICPGDLTTRRVKIFSESHINITIQLFTADPSFTISPTLATIAPGDSTSIDLQFRGIGAPDSIYYGAITIPTCNGTYLFFCRIVGDAPSITVHADNVQMCPSQPATQPMEVYNTDTIPRGVSISSATCSFDQAYVVIAPGDSVSIQTTFPARNVGTYLDTLIATDVCSNQHVSIVRTNVQTFPPVRLFFSSPPETLAIGEEKKFYVMTASRTPFTNGSVSLLLRNEPTALYFDSVVAPCAATVSRGVSSDTITISRCPDIQTDTVATVYYHTLIGSTFSPSVTLAEAFAGSPCQPFVADSAITVTLIPPGCELGTIRVHPFTTGLQSVFPIPANGLTVLTYATIEDATVTIELHDALGRTIATLVNTEQTPGIYQTTFDTRTLPSGMNYVTLREGMYSFSRQIPVVR